MNEYRLRGVRLFVLSDALFWAKLRGLYRCCARALISMLGALLNLAGFLTKLWCILLG